MKKKKKTIELQPFFSKQRILLVLYFQLNPKKKEILQKQSFSAFRHISKGKERSS